MIKVTYYYSACVAITTPDVSILCDPWFTDGIYDGSWYQYPKVKDPLELIGRHDLIYISHIHPDHYDPVFLKKYLEKHPDTGVIIGEDILSKKMTADGIGHLCVTDPKYQITHASYDRTDYKIIKNDTGSISDIDTALVVRYQDHVVVNMNDNQFYQPQIDAIKEFAPNIDIALLGHTGAGPYPQTYYKDKEVLEHKGWEKKMEFFGRYRKMATALDAKVNIPFAGQYILGGHLTHLNDYRGVSDAVEVLDFDTKAVVLKEGASIDTQTMEATATRKKPYSSPGIYLDEINNEMDYMKEFKYLQADKIPWGKLLHKAAKNALAKNEFKGEMYWIGIKFSDKTYVINLVSGSHGFFELKEPYSLIEIDYRYLFGLITGVYHWNNAEVGSQYMTTRVPDLYNRSVQRFLNFFTV